MKLHQFLIMCVVAANIFLLSMMLGKSLYSNRQLDEYTTIKDFKISTDILKNDCEKSLPRDQICVLEYKYVPGVKEIN